MKVLMTGAAGGVGTFLRPLLLKACGETYLSDLQPVKDLQPGEHFRAADLSDPTAVQAAVHGMDAIIHLGGQSVEAAWDVVLDANIKGTYHLFEAARQAGVSRIVFASTNHVVGFYERDQVIDSNVKVRPDSRYGVSKAFGEALGALYACKHGIRVTNLRIGNVGLLPLDKRRLSIWIHPEDLMQLIWIGLTHEAIENEVLYGASDNARSWWDNSRAVQLGYQPKHQSEQFAAQILASEQADDPIAEKFQGGTFCADEFSRR